MRQVLRSSISQIEDYNEEIYNLTDDKLEKLEKSIEHLRSLSNELGTMQIESQEMRSKCDIMKGTFVLKRIKFINPYFRRNRGSNCHNFRLNQWTKHTNSGEAAKSHEHSIGCQAITSRNDQ